MALASCNVQGIKGRAVFEGKCFGGGIREELLDDIEVTLFSGGEQGGLAQLIDLVHNSGPDISDLSIKLSTAEGPRHESINITEDLPDGGGVTALGGEVELGVIVAAGDLLDILLPRGAEALVGIGNDEGFVGIGDDESLAGRGEEDGGPWGGGFGLGTMAVIHGGGGRRRVLRRWGWG